MAKTKKTPRGSKTTAATVGYETQLWQMADAYAAAGTVRQGRPTEPLRKKGRIAIGSGGAGATNLQSVAQPAPRDFVQRMVSRVPGTGPAVAHDLSRSLPPPRRARGIRSWPYTATQAVRI